MNELSIEEKAKRYDELKVTAQELEKDGCFDKLTLFDLFPELRESEDERIRKAIIEYLRQRLDRSPSIPAAIGSWIDWLEKQDEKTEPIEDFDTEFERQISHLIASIINKEYSYTEAFVKWTSDALLNYAKHEIENHGEQILANSAKTCKDEQKPIKEHDVCDTCDEKASCVNPCPTKLIDEQKPAAWSEEDELHIRELESLVKRVWAIAEHEGDEETIHKMSDLSFFLKTLKPQLKQEWSEKDDEHLERILKELESQRQRPFNRPYLDKIESDYNWLKSLRPQSQWKPSNEQMDMLAKVCSTLHLTSGENEIMESIDALKKLKEK